MISKIIRSVCLFTDHPKTKDPQRLHELSSVLKNAGYEVQTCRLVSTGYRIADLQNTWPSDEFFIGAGTLSREESVNQLQEFLKAGNISFNLEINDHVRDEDVELLFRIIRETPEKTFNFSYTFYNSHSSPFFPASHYKINGFSIGLQPTNLTRGCSSLHTWLFRIREVWFEIMELFKDQEDFLGIDSSIAPMYSGDGSLINLMKRIHGSFSRSVTSDSYVNISKFIKEENPRPVGLNGLMFPCLEDFELAEEYEKGEFSIERNIFLSLHSGLGIDTYPVGIDENPDRIRQILNLVSALANKYKKPLSARFVSDGKASIGQITDFRNPYLKDIIIKQL
ncbi:MAG: DUF711 family protein [Bacteroidales bacterium]